MIIRAVDIENIRSHKSSHIEFKNGITVIRGDVGSGKTTIFEAIKFALFGGSSEQYRNLLRLNESQGSVSVLLENENGFVRITRKLKKTRDGYSGSGVFINVNGSEKEMSDREMKKFISEMFNVFQYRKRDPLFFKTVIYASQEEMKAIMFMKAEERREMILDLFQITSYNRIVENCEILKDHAKTRVEISKGILGEGGSRIYETRSQINEIKKKIDEFGEKIYASEKEFSYISEEKKKLQAKIEEMDRIKEQKEKTENFIGVYREKYDATLDELNKRKDKLKEIENKKEILKNLIQDENAYVEKEREISEMQLIQSEYNRLIMKKSVMENDLKHLFSRKDEISEKRKRIGEIVEELGYLKKKLVVVEEKDLENMKNELISLNFDLQNEERLLSEINAEIEDLKNLEKLNVCPKCKRPLDREHTEMLINDDLRKVDEREKRIRELLEKRKEMELKIMNMQEKVNENKKIEKEIEKLNDKKSALEEALSTEGELIKSIEELNIRIREINKRIESLHYSEEKFSIISTEIKRLKKLHEEYIKIENEIKVEGSVLEEIRSYSERASEIRGRIDEYVKFLNSLEFDDENYRKARIDLEGRTKQLERISANMENMNREKNEKIEEMKNREKELEMLMAEEKKMHNYSKFIEWIDETFIPGINAIISRRVNALRMEFEKEFREWFKIMLPGTEIEVGIDHDFSPVIRYGDYEMDFGALSGGESNALAFSYRLALNSMVKKFKLMETNFVLLDEPTDGFSENQIMQMGEVFSKLKVDQVLIVTHEDALENFADNRIKIIKEDGISKF